MQNRLQTTDLLKGLAVLFMVQVHIIELFATPEIYDSNYGKFSLFLGGPFVAPLFVTVLGYFIALSSKSTSQLVFRGIKMVLLGMFLNLALNLNLILKVKSNLLQIDIWPYIFGIDIFHFAGFSIIILALLKKIFERNILLLAIFIVISASLSDVVKNIIQPNEISTYFYSLLYGCSKWSYFPLFPWIAYPLAGMLLFNLKKQFTFNWLYLKKTKLIILVSFILFMVFTINYAISVASNLQEYYHHGIKFCAWTIAFLLFYSYFINEINLYFNQFKLLKFIAWLGTHVTIIYIIQWIIIGNIATEIYKTINEPYILITYYISILIACIVITRLYLEIKKRITFKL